MTDLTVAYDATAEQRKQGEQMPSSAAGDPAAGDKQPLVTALQALHRQAGKPSYRTIAKEVGNVSHTTVAEALGGRRVPSWSIVESIVRHLGGDENRIRELWVSATDVNVVDEPPVSESDFVARYRRNVALYYGPVYLSSALGRVRGPLDEVYVSPNVTLVPGGDRADVGAVVDGVRHLVLLGDPGSGKTTASKALVHRFATTEQEIVPFLVPVREFAAGPTLSHSIVGYLERLLDTVFQCRPPQGAITDLARRGSALVIFDGLDEVDDAARHDQLISAIELFVVEFPDVRVVVTTRPVTHDRRALDPTVFTTFRLASFDEDQVRRLVSRTLAATVPARTASDVADLTEAFLRDTASFADIRTNPALLALALSFDRDPLPLDRVKFFDALLTQLLAEGGGERAMDPLLPPTIGQLAFHLLSERNDQPVVGDRELVTLVADYMRDRDQPDALARRLAEYLVDRSAVLQMVGTTSEGEQLYTFRHRSVLEYCAATYLTETHTVLDDLAENLAGRLAEPQWFNVGLFAVLIVDKTFERGAERIVRALIEHRTSTETVHRAGLEDFLRQCAQLTYLPRHLTREISDTGLLFPDPSTDIDEHIGYRGPAACQIAGITYRQLDYWARTGLVTPSVRLGRGEGRLYSIKDVLLLTTIKRLLDTSVSLSNIRLAVEHLRARDIEDLRNVTLFSDGETFYEATSPEEIVDLLQNGRGVFGIAISGALQEIMATIHEFPAERPDSTPDLSEDIAEPLHRAAQKATRPRAPHAS